MRRQLAEVAREMFIKVSVDSCASAKELRSIAMKANPTGEELVFIDRAIAEYMKLRSRLNRTLTVKGDVEVIKMLAHAKKEDVDRLQPSDARITVGPFSYNIYVNSDKASLICEDLANDGGSAFEANSMYPWSVIVSDRTKKMAQGNTLLALLNGEMTSSQVERHEDMHQFYDFFRNLSRTHDEDDDFCQVMSLNARLNKLTELGAPEIILRNERDKLDAAIAKLPRGSRRDDYDYWANVEELARRGFVAEISDRAKSELLAFLWSCDMSDLMRRLKCGYLCGWIESGERTLGLDLSAEGEKLSSIMDSAVSSLDKQFKALLDERAWDKHELVQLLAMMNIDLPLNQWGTTM